MKPVFKCDYCSEMGTEEEIKEHEIKCIYNYDRRSCCTCVHKNTRFKNDNIIYECKADKEIPVGKIFEFCSSYERNKNAGFFGGLFKGPFGW